MCQRAHTRSHLSAQTYLSCCHLLTSLSFYLNFARASPRAFGRTNEAAWENYPCPFLWSRRGQRRAAEMAVSWPFLPCLILHRMGVSYMILHMFQCHFPNLPTLSLSNRVHKTVLYISVSFAVLYTGLLLPSFYIPYKCVSILYWCFSFWLTSLCIIGSSFIHLIRTDSNVFFLMAE